MRVPTLKKLKCMTQGFEIIQRESFNLAIGIEITSVKHAISRQKGT